MNLEEAAEASREDYKKREQEWKHYMHEESSKDLYSIQDFVYWISKYNNMDEKKWTEAEIAAIVARALINFLPDTNTPY